MSDIKKFNRDFFSRSTLLVAKELIGQYLHYNNSINIITETEAYCGVDDPASHAYRGITSRNRVMFGEAGYSYVYLIYGMYHCLNIVSEIEGSPGAVLIRGLYNLNDKINLNGPGKVCRHFNITRQHNNLDLINNPDFFVSESTRSYCFEETPRIGIKVGKELNWRFVLKSLKQNL